MWLSTDRAGNSGRHRIVEPFGDADTSWIGVAEKYSARAARNAAPSRVAQLNWRAMLYFRIRDCNVVRFSPRRAAAPSGPPTVPLASSSAFRILARSGVCDSVDDLL